nr:uncharacterized protein LOC123568391 [Macaca fascicularis]
MSPAEILRNFLSCLRQNLYAQGWFLGPRPRRPGWQAGHPLSLPTAGPAWASSRQEYSQQPFPRKPSSGNTWASWPGCRKRHGLGGETSLESGGELCKESVSEAFWVAMGATSRPRLRGERGIMGNVVLRSPVPSHSQPQALGLLLDPKLVTPCYLPERDDKGSQTWDLKAIVSGLEMFFYFKIFLLSINYMPGVFALSHLSPFSSQSP